jgi:threonine dehydrogenase-like Zn-dependent dehydrogenase
MYHGKIPFEKNHILGHEFVGIVEEIGADVKTLKPGDKVLGTSSIACGHCFYCKMGLYSQCENSNPNGESTAFFGGPKEAGGFQGAQAEFIRVPFADTVLYKIPEGITDKQALIISDILTTGWFGADMAEIKPGESVAVYGAGPVGQMAMLSAKVMGASKIIAINHIDARLDMAKEHTGAIPINYSNTDPVDEIMKLTDNNGVDKVIEAVGLEAQAGTLETLSEALRLEMSSGRSVRWAIDSVRKGGVVSVIGVFAGDMDNFPIGTLQKKNITLRAGNCPHRKYVDTLINLIKEGKMEPSYVITSELTLDNIDDAYRCFDKNKGKCLKDLITV